MGLGNRNAKEGNKGSNYSYEIKSLRALSKLDQLAGGTTSTVTSVASDVTVQTLVAANPDRKSVKITNDGNHVLYVREGSGATTSLYTWKLMSDEMAIIDDYLGEITGIWDVAHGDAVITETT